MSTIKIKAIREEMGPVEGYWNYTDSTNCYAFALGLDVPESRILKHAYQLGVIGATIKNIPIRYLRYMTYEERLFLDMEALKITCEKTSMDSMPAFYETKKYSYTKWVISLLENEDDFHFLRKYHNGIWYHKRGYTKYPTNLDSNKQIITDLNKCSISDYHYVGTYLLECKTKRRVYRGGL